MIDENSNDTKEIEDRYGSLLQRESEMNRALDKVYEESKKDQVQDKTGDKVDHLEAPKNVVQEDSEVESQSINSDRLPTEKAEEKQGCEHEAKPQDLRKSNADLDDCGDEHASIDTRIVSDVIDPSSALIMVQGNFTLHLACALMTFLLKPAREVM